MTNTVMAVAAGALYSASYVAPREWCPVCLVRSALLVIIMRGL